MMHVIEGWDLPNEGFIKINCHRFFPEECLANGNRAGVGVVFRNDRGTIVRMIVGSLGIEERRLNELYAIHFDLKRAFYEEYSKIELDVNSVGAYWEWRNARADGVPQDHAFIVEQLEKRRRDRNQTLKIHLIDEDANRLAMYIAEYGANRWDMMVVLTGPFGRVRELWSRDMGLGPIGPRFREINEADLEAEVLDGAEEEDDLIEAAFEDAMDMV